MLFRPVFGPETRPKLPVMARAHIKYLGSWYFSPGSVPESLTTFCRGISQEISPETGPGGPRAARGGLRRGAKRPRIPHLTCFTHSQGLYNSCQSIDSRNKRVNLLYHPVETPFQTRLTGDRSNYVSFEPIRSNLIPFSYSSCRSQIHCI